MSTARSRFLDGPFPRAFAHRGWHIDELAGLEDALSAFRRAVAEGYTYLELDVHATRDDVVVVNHDPTLERTTDATGAIAELSWQRVREARIAGREPVCRLVDVLEELPTALVNVDVKADRAVAPVLDVLRYTNSWHRVCLASFSGSRLRRIRRESPPTLVTSIGMPGAGLLRVRSLLPSWLPLPGGARAGPQLAQVPREYGPVRIVDPRFVRTAHRGGLEVHVWTIDHAETMTALLEQGVDGIMTDRPDVLRDVLRDRGSWQTTVP